MSKQRGQPTVNIVAAAERAAVKLQLDTPALGIGDLASIYATAERYALDAGFAQLYTTLGNFKIPRETDKEARVFTYLGSSASIGRVSVSTEIERGTGSFEGRSFLAHVVDAPNLALRARYSLPWEHHSDPQESLGPQDSFWIHERVDGMDMVIGRVYVLGCLAAAVRNDIQSLFKDPAGFLARADQPSGSAQ